MNRDAFKRAKKRLFRAWNEAEYRYSRRTLQELSLLRREGKVLEVSNADLHNVFNALDGTPCSSCRRCCTQAAFSVGFHTHVERESLLANNNKHAIYSYIVADWGEVEQPPERCLFLKPNGCNLPARLRSGQCSTYVCLDKMGPAIARQKLESKYRKVSGKRSESLRIINNNLKELSFETEVSSLDN